MSGLPRVGRGRRTTAQQAIYEAELQAFCDNILEIKSTLDFDVSARGWCYLLEGRGLITKGEFDRASDVINDCRKSGRLPLDICAQDATRSAENIEYLHSDDVVDEAYDWIQTLRSAHRRYKPVSFWDYQDTYIEMAVEKVDLKSLFTSVCAEFFIPIRTLRVGRISTAAPL